MSSKIPIDVVLVCQNTTCRQQQAPQVLQRLQELIPKTITLKPCGCLGQCGNGVMVLVLPEKTWYAHVRPDDVPVIVQQHFQHGQPVRSLLYRKFHPAPKSPWIIWSILSGVAVLAAGILAIFKLVPHVH